MADDLRATVIARIKAHLMPLKTARRDEMAASLADDILSIATVAERLQTRGPSEPKAYADMRAALGRQTARADTAERQVRDLTADNKRLRRLLAEKVSGAIEVTTFSESEPRFINRTRG